jgi:plasmid stability protein
MHQILTRNVPDRVYQALRRRAESHHASLEAEVRAILAQAAESEGFALPALLVPKDSSGKTLAQIVAEGRR